MKLTEKKRKDIVDAAIVEFREKGYSGTTMNQIAKRANVAIRTLYKHFESKDVLFEAITEIIVSRKATTEPVAYDPDRDLTEQLVDALEVYIKMVTDPEAMGAMRLIVSEYLRDLDKSRAFFTQLASYDYPVVELIRKAMDAGALEKSDAQFATGQLLALVRNYYSWPVLLFGAPQATDDTLDECVTMFLARYGRKQRYSS